MTIVVLVIAPEDNLKNYVANSRFIKFSYSTGVAFLIKGMRTRFYVFDTRLPVLVRSTFATIVTGCHTLENKVIRYLTVTT